MSNGTLGDGMVDSGVGRTLSSYGRPRMRSRSEERMSTMPVMSNGLGPMFSARSEALSEPITKPHSRNRNCVDYRPKQNSILTGIPPPPQSKIFSQCEQSSNCVPHQEADKNKNDKYRKKEKADTGFDGTEDGGKLQVPPLCSERLQPTRHRTKNAFLSILDHGEVCIEFIKRRNGTVRVIKT